MTKPFSLRELAARVRAVLRQRSHSAPPTTSHIFRGRHLVADFDAVSIVANGTPVRLDDRNDSVVPEAFGLSASSVSRRFLRASARQLRRLLERRLDAEMFLAVVIDGKTFADDGMVTAVGVTEDERARVRGVPPRLGGSRAPRG